MIVRREIRPAEEEAAPPGRNGGAYHDPDRMPSFLRRLLVVSVVVSLLFAAIFIWSDKGLGELRRLDRHGAELTLDIETLHAENDRLQREIEGFRHAKLRVERLAREELGLVRPGEVVVILPTEAGRPPADRTDPPVTAEIRERRVAAAKFPVR